MSKQKTKRIVLAIICSFSLFAFISKKNTAMAIDLSVRVNFTPHEAVTPEAIIEVRLNRTLAVSDGRLLVMLGRTDITSLFVVNDTRRIFVPSLIPLPLGKTELIVYLIGADDNWRELGRFPLQVAEKQAEATGVARQETAQTEPAVAAAEETPTPPATKTSKHAFGFDKLSFVPSVTLAAKSQPAQSNFPASTRPTQRATFTDGTIQFSGRGELARGPLAVQAQFDFAGSTFGQEALRFGTLGERAPNIDLASYLVQLQLGPAKVELGHSSYGGFRHLISGFSSRGISITVPITKRFDVSAAAMNGTSLVGYGNFSGLNKNKHQLQSATIGFEFFPERRGGLRIEVGGLNGYFQSVNSFSQGSVNDVERSKGLSVRVVFSDKDQRLKLDGGFTRSIYRNPADPLLYQGTNTIAVPFLSRSARYIEGSYDVLRGFQLTKSMTASLSLSFRHEKIDPLFKSLGASTQPDKAQNEFSLSGSLGEISLQAGHLRFNDNLRDIPSILKSLTRGDRVSVALPAAVLFGGNSNTSKFLPRLSYSLDRTHQFGAATPVDGGFQTDASLIPDQLATNQTISADWQISKFSVGYNYNRSFTDNSQPGREASDFLSQTSGARVGFTPFTKLNVNFEVGRDSSSDLENAKLLRTWRVGSTASWNVTKYFSWTAGVSNTIAGDRAETNGSRNTEFDTQISFRKAFERGEFRKVQSQMFVRYASRYARTNDLTFSINNLTRVKIVTAGLNLTFF